jgi:ATP/ADP translocase
MKTYRIALAVLLLLPVVALLLTGVFFFGGALGRRVAPNTFVFVPLEVNGHLTPPGVLAVVVGVVYIAALALVLLALWRANRKPQSVAPDEDAWPPAPKA